jgi:hypothetical protein
VIENNNIKIEMAQLSQILLQKTSLFKKSVSKNCKHFDGRSFNLASIEDASHVRVGGKQNDDRVSVYASWIVPGGQSECERAGFTAGERISRENNGVYIPRAVTEQSEFL